MYFTAWKARFNKSLANPKVFILVDRVDLDDQIFETFTNAGGKNISCHFTQGSKKNSVTEWNFITTIQKFSETGNKVEKSDENVIILSMKHTEEMKEFLVSICAMRSKKAFSDSGTPVDKQTPTRLEITKEKESAIRLLFSKQSTTGPIL